VSGVAALLLAQYPGLPYRQLMIRLVGGSEPLLSLSTASRSAGRLNAYGALSTHPRVAFPTLASAIDLQRGMRVRAEVTDDGALRDVALHYSIEGGEFAVIPMQHVDADVYEGWMPLQEPGSAVALFVRAVDESGNTGLSPTWHYRTGSP
jgi:hypothetical protein